MVIDIRARIREKSQIPKTELALDDVNKDLIMSLFAVDVYGAEARDEEILNIIIGGGQIVKDARAIMRADFEKISKSEKLKKGKDGMWRDKDGYIVLEPS